MVFSSYIFLFGFLPVAFILTHSARTFLGVRRAIILLVLCSLFFYGYWNVAYLPIIIGSIIANYLISCTMLSMPAGRARRMIFFLGILGNILCLSYYKYTDFLITTFNSFGTSFQTFGILLPIGISFFTFQQIAFLADTYKDNNTRYSFWDYALFISFFPQLIAGPIVHHKEFLPQTKFSHFLNLEGRDLAIGIGFLVLGLFKKLVIADGFSFFANDIFSAADAQLAVSTTEAWLGALAYTFQIYFDFSGYSDMAIGLGRFFGVVLPANFMSPYKASDISLFWRRWHMTLSAFLRDYLYIPLGGNRNGRLRQGVNMMITMLIGGLWHGAGWNFVIWGGLHGMFLASYQTIWPMLKTGLRITRLPTVIAVLITFFCVVLAWVPFRAETIQGALGIWSAMFLDLDISAPIGAHLGNLLAPLGFAKQAPLHVSLTDWLSCLPLFALAGIIVFALPNTNEFIERHVERAAQASQVRARYVAASGLLAVLFCISIVMIGKETVFLYFQF